MVTISAKTTRKQVPVRGSNQRQAQRHSVFARIGFCLLVAIGLFFFVGSRLGSRSGGHHRRQQEEGEETYQVVDVQQENLQDSSSVEDLDHHDNLLKFDIIGFAKTGTTFLSRRWLNRHPQICMPWDELGTWDIDGIDGEDENEEDLQQRKRNAIRATTRALWNLTKQENDTKATRKTTTAGTAGTADPVVRDKDSVVVGEQNCQWRGFKSPGQVLRPEALKVLSDVWPHAKLIVGVRHPILWFQSMFNYRVRRGTIQLADAKNIDAPMDLLQERACRNNTCTYVGMYHVFLSYLGKTPLESHDELSLFQWQQQLRTRSMAANSAWDRARVQYPPVPNPIFLYDLKQLNAEENDGIFEQLSHDLSRYLQLPSSSTSLPPPIHATTENQSKRNNMSKLNICDSQHDDLRADLVLMGTKSAQWILEYFVHSPDVTVSSPEFFTKQLEHWKYDPCDGVEDGVLDDEG